MKRFVSPGTVCISTISTHVWLHISATLANVSQRLHLSQKNSKNSMARSQPAGNQSRLRYTNSTESVGKTSGAEAAREWLKPLPPTLSDQYSGIVGLLHSSILQFLKLIRPGLPEPTAIDLDEQRKLLLLWRDDKNDIEEIIMRYPNLGIHVISNLADLALVLSQGTESSSTPLTLVAYLY